MNLDLFNHFTHDEKEHSFTLKFIDELTEYLNHLKDDILKEQVSHDLSGFLTDDELMSKYKISSTLRSDFYQKRNEILEDYSKTLEDDKSIYYVSWNNNLHNKYDENNIYTIDEYLHGKLVKEIHVSRSRFA